MKKFIKVAIAFKNGGTIQIVFHHVNSPPKRFRGNLLRFLISSNNAGETYSFWHIDGKIGEGGADSKLEQYNDYEDDYLYFSNLECISEEQMEFSPLWCIRFVTDFTNWITNLSSENGGLKCITILCSPNVRTTGYLGIKCNLLLGATLDKRDDYSRQRLQAGLFAAEIDRLNILLKKTLHQYNALQGGECRLSRIAITFLDSGLDFNGKFIFCNADGSKYVSDAAREMELRLVGHEAESFTSFLIRNKINTPISLGYSKGKGQGREGSFFIDYLGKSFAVLINPNWTDLVVKDIGGERSLYLINQSNSLKLGLIENFKLIHAVAKKAIAGDGNDEVKLYFYPINYGICLDFFPAFALFLVSGKQGARKIQQVETFVFPSVRAHFASALSIESMVLLKKARRFACKSAIGAIMSRNGSHNIGSHVLAALSHNVGTMPEDRKLYQYIQHRMDYIATATTEFPSWRQPTMLVSDMMRTFMSQTHLLSYISQSEGLHAYQFQNPAMDQALQYQTIKLHVRRVQDVCAGDWEKETLDATWNGKIDNFIIYKNEEQAATFERDLSVAIPGGVVGQHAFFTILENTIRNAAKHEWAKASKNEKEKGNLEVYIDFHDNPEKGVVEMLVWNDRVGVAKTDMEATVRHLREKFKRSFISPDSGELVRENWGLAEMRISAGYLKNAGIDVIGGIGEETGERIELVRPVVVLNGKKQCLGFRFDLQKPKELLVVVPDSVDIGDLQSINKILTRFGIEMKSLKDVCAKNDLAYSYVLINGFDFDQDERLWPKLPFRVLAPSDVWKRKNTSRRIAHYDGSFYCVTATKMAEAIKQLNEEFCNPQRARTFAHDLLEDVYASWIHHVRSMQKRAEASMLVVDVEGGEEGRAKSLVTDSDLLHFVFEHSFNSAVRGYLKTVPTDQISPQLAGALYSLAMLQSRTIMSVEDFSAISSGDDILDIKQRIATQLIKLAEQAMSSLPAKIEITKTDQEGKRYVDDRWGGGLCNLMTRECLYYLFMGCGKILKSGSGHADVRAFVEYLHAVVLEQAKSFLSKYEERVVTVPRSFGVMKREGSSKKDTLADKPVVWKREKHDEAVLSAFFSSNRDKASDEGYLNGGLCYWRHGDDDSDTSKEADKSKKEAADKQKTSRLENVLYFEPLSGSQSYLNSLIALQQDLPHLQDETSDKRLSVIRELTGLVENALMHILIIDERATKFAQEHPEVARIFKDAGICVCDDTNPAISDLIKPKPKFSRLNDNAKTTAKDFEIVIVHQGIIDKLLKNHTQANVGQVLDSLMQHLRYLVVTTGRGTPFNIPPTARVLPFSVVESTLFKRYPEKMLLVDTVMHLLPGERK